MSTRCLIGLEYDDGSVEALYCHFDGYLEGVGKRLLDHYSDYGDVYELFEEGFSLNSLGDSINTCKFDYRDESIPIKCFENKEEFSKANYPYLYLFSEYDFKWYCKTWQQKEKWMTIPETIAFEKYLEKIEENEEDYPEEYAKYFPEDPPKDLQLTIPNHLKGSFLNFLAVGLSLIENNYGVFSKEEKELYEFLKEKVDELIDEEDVEQAKKSLEESKEEDTKHISQVIDEIGLQKVLNALC
jgi:hypothetical protein